MDTPDVWYDCRWQALNLSLIVGERHGAQVLDCRVALRWTSALVFALEGGASPITVDVDLEDRGVVNEAIDGGERHGGIWKDLAPSTERLIGGDQGGSTFVSGADQLEQDGGFGLILADIGEVVEDQQMEAIEPVDGGLERQFAAGGRGGRGRGGGGGGREAAAVAFGDLVLGKCGEEACSGPAFLVRALGQCGPILLDRGQTKVVEHQRQAGAVDALGHAASPISAPRSAS